MFATIDTGKPAETENHMTSSTTRRRITQGLIEAWRSGQRWQVDFSEMEPSPADAYQIQADVAQALGWFTQGPRAWKVGGYPNASAAPLPEVLSSPASWAAPFGDAVLVEAELAFRLGRTPSGPAELLSCLETVCVSIELVDTRLAGGLQAPAVWKLADQSVHGSLVTGREQPCGPYIRFGSADWARQGCSLMVNGRLARRVAGGHPNGDPLCALPWLAEHAAAQGGGLRAGDLITTGAWIAQAAGPGDLIEVAFEGLDSASVRITA